MLDMGLVSNGNNSTIGDFDCARVDKLIAALVPIAEEAGNALPAGLSCSDVVTNEFIDPSIGLG
jgi:hypothetical protein